MTFTRNASAVWTGGVQDGRGAISTQSGALKDQAYGFGSRFEDKAGTNPEELLGAAHAGCFTMALALMLTESGHPPTRLETTAQVDLEKTDQGYSIPSVRLVLEATVPGVDNDAFQAIAAKAKANCPVSRVLKADITLDARLKAGDTT